MRSLRRIGIIAGCETASALGGLSPATTHAESVRVQVTNLAPDNGVYVTPVWAGVHDGIFDVYNKGEAASAALERPAEDANNAPLLDMSNHAA